MTTALSSLLALIDHAKSGQMPCLEGCDNYEKSVVFVQTLRLMGFEAEVAEGSFRLLSNLMSLDTSMALSGVRLPAQDIGFVSTQGEVGIEVAMMAYARRFHEVDKIPDMALSVSRMNKGSVPIENYLNQNPPPPFMEAVNIGLALLQSKQLEQSFDPRPDQARPRF